MRIVWLSANRFGYDLILNCIKLNKVDAVITLSNKSKIKMYDGLTDRETYPDLFIGEYPKLNNEYSRDRFKKHFDIPTYQVESIKNQAKLLKRLKPNIVVMVGWREVIPRKLLSIPTKAWTAIHPTYLPVGRGPAPIINTILHGFKESGVTWFECDDGLDSGPIISQCKFIVDKDETARSLLYKSLEHAEMLMEFSMDRYCNDILKATPQDDSKAFTFTKPETNEILPEDTAEIADRKIRAFGKPYDGAYIKRGDKKIIIWKGELDEGRSKR